MQTYAYSGGNTRSMMKHFRISHRDMPIIVADFPATPVSSATKLKHDVVQASIVQEIEKLKPMPPDNRVAAKITDCLSDHCSLNNCHWILSMILV